MRRIRTILAVTDYSDAGRRAELRAAMLCAEHKAEVFEVLTVAERDQDLEQALAARAHDANRIPGEDAPRAPLFGASHGQVHAGAACARTAGFGAPAYVVTRRAEELRVDLTIASYQSGKVPVGKQRHADALELIRLADSPVLLVKREPRHAYRKTLLATDFGDASIEAVRMCMRIAPGAHHTLFHTLGGDVDDAAVARAEDIVYLSRYRTSELAARRLNELAAMLGSPREALSRVVRFGKPVAAITQFASRIDADLVAIGKTGEHGMSRSEVGIFAARLVNELDCDVLIVPGEPEGWPGGTAA
ncbi:MAG TPA: universal stress protein [Noviherbaspirillum sp.]|nr:universal stress protein [Noviherbaspirillum sp.]